MRCGFFAAILNKNVSVFSLEKIRALCCGILPFFLSLGAFFLEFGALSVIATHFVAKYYKIEANATHTELSQAVFPCMIAWVVSHVYKRLAFVQHFVLNRYLLLACSVFALISITYALLLVLSYLLVTWPAAIASMHWILLVMAVLLSEWVGIGYIVLIMISANIMMFKLFGTPFLSLQYSDEVWAQFLLASRIILGTYVCDWIRTNVGWMCYNKIVSRSIFPPGFDQRTGMDSLRGDEETGAPDNIVNFAVSNWRRTAGGRSTDNIEVSHDGMARTDRNRYSNDSSVMEGWAWKQGRSGSEPKRRWFSLCGSVVHYSDGPNGRHLGSFSIHGASIVDTQSDDNSAADIPMDKIKSAYAPNADAECFGKSPAQMLVIQCDSTHKDGKRYQLAFSTEIERDKWMECLSTHVHVGKQESDSTGETQVATLLQATVLKLGGRKQNVWQARGCTLHSSGLSFENRRRMSDEPSEGQLGTPRTPTRTEKFAGARASATIRIFLPHRSWSLSFTESDSRDDKNAVQATCNSPPAPPPDTPQRNTASGDHTFDQNVVKEYANEWKRKLQAAAQEHKQVRSEMQFDPAHKSPMRIDRAVSLSSSFLTTGTGDYAEDFAFLKRFDESVMRAIGWDLGATIAVRGSSKGSCAAATRAVLCWLPFAVFLVGICHEAAGDVAVAALVTLVMLLAPVIDLIDERWGKTFPAPLCSHPMFTNLMNIVHMEHVKPDFPVSLFLADAGFVDNLGLLPLLARQEVDILSLASGTIPEQIYQLKHAMKLARAYLQCSFFVGSKSDPDLEVYLETQLNDVTIRTVSFFVLYRQSSTVGRVTFARPIRDQDAPLPAVMSVVASMASLDEEQPAAGSKTSPAKRRVFQACWEDAAQKPFDDKFPAHDVVSFNTCYGQKEWFWYMREGFAAGEEWLSQYEELTDAELCPLDIHEQVANKD